MKHSVKEPGRAAEIRESHNEKIYENLTDDYHFVPICAETLGSWGPQGLALIKTIGKKLSAATAVRGTARVFWEHNRRQKVWKKFLILNVTTVTLEI